MTAPKGRGAAWTEERGTSDEGPPSQAARQARRCRAAHAFQNAKIVVLPRTGHVAQMERPELVAAEIGMLLGRAADRGADAERAREFPVASAG